MYCVNCGKELTNNAQICEGCGTSYAVSSAVGANAVAPAQQIEEKRRPISVWGWIGRSLFACIPVAGWLVYFIMLFVWASDKEKEVSFNNWAKAQLWVLLVVASIALITVLLILFVFGTAFR